MSQVKMGINGFGRIGRLVMRSAFTQNAGKAKVMAINDPFMDIDYLIYLMTYDSVHVKPEFISFRTLQGYHRKGRGRHQG